MWLYGLNFLSFAGISMINTQMIPYLSELGYSVVERGYILAANAVIAIVGQFLFGYLCDRYKRIKRFFFMAYVLFIASSLAMFLFQQQLFYYHFFTVAFMAGMVKVIMGLNETWMLEVDEENYGKLRAAGALGLTIGSPIAGFILDQASYLVLLLVFSSICMLLFLCLYKSQDAKKKNTGQIHIGTLKKLFSNKQYLILVLIYLFIYMIGTADQYVVIDKMLSIDAGSKAVGIKWALQSFMEVPLFLMASKILNKWKPGTLLKAGTLLYGVKFVLYGLSSKPWMIIASASLQIVTLPVIMLTSKVMIKDVTPANLFSSAQMFAMAIFIGVSGLITPIITAYLSKQVGYNVTLYIVAAFSLIPWLFIIYYLKHWNVQDNQEKK